MTDVAIYVLTHTPTNTAYVGSSIRPYERIGEHIRGAGAKCSREWIASLPESLPSFRIGDWCDESDRVLVEEAWIIHYALVLGYEMVNVSWRPWPPDTIACQKGGGFKNPKTRAKAQATRRANGHYMSYSPFHDSEFQTRMAKRANGKGAKIAWARHRDILIEATRKGGRRGIRKMSREARQRGGYNQPIEAKRKGGTSCRDAKTGMFGRSEKQWSKDSRKAYKLGLGKLTPEQRSKHGRRVGHKGGNVSRERGVGVHGLSRPQKSVNSQKALHTRWHINRGLVNPACKLCKDTV